MKRHGSTTVSRGELVEALHALVAYDAAQVVADDIHDGTILDTAYLGSVTQVSFTLGVDEELEVEWEAIVHNA